MYKTIIISALTAYALGINLSKKTITFKAKKNNIIHKEIVDDIKNQTWMWKPYEAEENPLANKTDDELQGLIGAMTEDDGIPDLQGADNEVPEWSGASYTPFDSRTKWGNCIQPVVNQGSCGSCWAFSTTEVLSDRLCIASEGKINVVLSPQYVLSCSMRNGCGGGYPNKAFDYLGKTGAPVTACVPYKGTANNCPATCSDASQSFKKYKCKSGSTVTIQNNVDGVMDQI